MTMIYTPKQERPLQEDRAKDAVIEQQVGRKPISPEERDRIWRTIQDAARSALPSTGLWMMGGSE